MTYGEIFFLISKATCFLRCFNIPQTCLGSHFSGFVLFHVRVNVRDKYVSHKQLNLPSRPYRSSQVYEMKIF